MPSPISPAKASKRKKRSRYPCSLSVPGVAPAKVPSALISDWLTPTSGVATVFFQLCGRIGQLGRITMAEIVASTSFCALIAGQFLAVLFAHNYRNAA
jgi:hypothetical protein